jgi:hypothetical protein
MSDSRLLLTIGLVRQARPDGFCPACRVLMKARDARHELAKPMAAALVVLAVAGAAWATWSTIRAPWRERREWRWDSARSSPSLRRGS